MQSVYILSSLTAPRTGLYFATPELDSIVLHHPWDAYEIRLYIIPMELLFSKSCYVGGSDSTSVRSIRPVCFGIVDPTSEVALLYSTMKCDFEAM